MLRIASGLLAAAVVATLIALLPGGAEARDMAAIRACGGPARNYNQCLAVCGCMGGKRCFSSCATKDFSKGGKRRGGGFR